VFAKKTKSARDSPWEKNRAAQPVARGKMNSKYQRPLGGEGLEMGSGEYKARFIVPISHTIFNRPKKGVVKGKRQLKKGGESPVPGNSSGPVVVKWHGN